MVNREAIKNPITLAAILCSFMLYSGIAIPRNPSYLRSPLAKNRIYMIRGTIVSNPVKSSGDADLYAIDTAVSFVFSKEMIGYACRGTIKVYIPKNFVEAHLPGKLYTDFSSIAEKSEKIPLLFEKGAKIVLNVRYSKKNDVFYAQSGYSLGWKKSSKCCKSNIYWIKSLSGKIGRFRALCRLHFKRLMYGWGAAGGFILALLSGSREYTEKVTSDAFRNAGLSYILALSGMHLSLFSGIAVFFWRKTAGEKFSYIFSLAASLFFVWFAGISPSLLRALLCSILLTLSSVIGIPDVGMLSVLSLSFLLHAAISPSDIMQPAFMLSYSALAGILIMQDFAKIIVSRFMPTALVSGFSSAAGAQLFTIPVSLKLFGTFMPGAVPASVAVSPVVTVFLWISVLLIPLSLLFPGISTVSGYCLGFLYKIIKMMVTGFAYIPAVRV